MRLRSRLAALGRRPPLRYDRLDWIILGLGNPGGRYEHTRHNAGRLALERLARAAGLKLSRGDGRFQAARWERPAGAVFLARPTTYMNESGAAAERLAELTGLGPERFLVLVDDIELPLGRLRLRGKGSSGGHRGLDSLIACLHSDGFARLRLGIGKPAGDAAQYVLDEFGPQEEEALERMLEAAAGAVCRFLDQGLEPAMSSVNAPPGT